MNCPRCTQPMRAYRLEGHLGREVEIDVCAPCQSIWFDAQESLQLTPGAILAVFRIAARVATVSCAARRTCSTTRISNTSAVRINMAA